MPEEPQPNDRRSSTAGFLTVAPRLDLPKGGGAIRGIGEKFEANPVTGSAGMTIPISSSPGRSGFGPQLSVSYDSGSGNGPFGFGWSLSLPAVSRKTDKGLPLYRDVEDSDVFVLSGAEDLVPEYRRDLDGAWIAAHPGRIRDPEGWVRDQAGSFVVHEDEIDGYRVRRYRPRIEGQFARIERWSKVDVPGERHWRSISKDNVLTIYGLDLNSRIVDPLDTTRIFSWLISETRDDAGNAILYRYKAEDGRGADLDQACERNRGPRDDIRRTANRYIKRIHYGNRRPLLDDAGSRPHFLDQAQVADQIANAGWMFELVFDYRDHDLAAPRPTDDELRDAAGSLKYPWKPRSDPFSNYRPGFEVRTTRLCRRALLFHHFPAEAAVGRDCLVRSTDFTYSDEVDPTDVRNPVYAFLRAVRQTGYRRQGAGYRSRSLPPVEFDYTEPTVEGTVQLVDPSSLENLPIGLDGSAYRWADLHGEGVAGILAEQADGWYYKPNLSPIPTTLPNGQEVVSARFAPLQTIALRPNATLREGAEIVDLAGDGQPDVLLMDGRAQGFYEHDDAEGWRPFRPFASQLNRDMRDPNLKLVDLDGDGHADVLITEDDALVWHASLAEAGFGPAQRVPQAPQEENGPRVVFADGTQSVYLADLAGDGLTDLVRIKNGDVCYWPNLGYGHFGAKVTMDNAPVFDHPDQFDQERVRLADIDGSGTTDLIYLHGDGVRLYFNQSGNGWSKSQPLKAFARVDDAVNIVPLDLLGSGTTCLVWSSPSSADARRPLRYVNLMSSGKPHLLCRTSNNLGAETRVDYAPSTKFYLQDKRDGRPWITRLPFPVHTVEKVTTYDHVSRNLFVTRYAYHHGFFDGEEREFRGFGMVEQWDTERLAALGSFPLSTNISDASHVPPVHTKTWFHTGAYVGRDKISRVFDGEYFREPGLSDAEAEALLLPDTVLPDGLTGEEEPEACRALKGSTLRHEVYTEDAADGATAEQLERARMPYTVTEHALAVRVVQPRGGNRHAVLFAHERESISYHYERNPGDPRIQHALTLEVDERGDILKQAVIGYGRRTMIRTVDAQGQAQLVPNAALAALQPADRAKQTTALLTYSENAVTNAVESADTYRAPLPCEARMFELTGYAPTGLAGRFQGSDVVEPDPAAPGRLRHRFTKEVAYEATAAGSRCRRPIEWVRTLYRRDHLTGLLPLGQLQPRGLPGESYTLAFTPGLLAQVFRRPRSGQSAESLLPDPAAVLGGQAGNRGGYVRSQTLKADGRFPATDADDHWWVPSGRAFFTTDPADSPTAELAEARQHFFLPRRYRNSFGEDSFVGFDTDDLLLVETRDALSNRVVVDGVDYRVLEPALTTDPNGNRTEVVFDTLGMVVGTAIMGKPMPEPVEGDDLTGFASDLAQADVDAFFAANDPHTVAPALLRGATTRIVYDVERFLRTKRTYPDDPKKWQPACAATLSRETHASASLPSHGLKLQVGVSYSDGFGREIQKKLCAEPGPLVDGGPSVSPRWVGSGWTIFNNKGKPVRQYEAFFSDTHDFEFGAQVGVSPVLFYDPTERVVATLHPNNTFAKVVLDPWQQTAYDVSDTCAPRNQQTGDPRTDRDIRGYVEGYFKALPAAATWRTWRAQRLGGALGADERAAAVRAAAHADTPSTVHLDVLGRGFLTVDRNRVVCAGHDLDGTEEDLASRVELDIEANQRVVRDAVQQAGDPLGRIVARYAYDMLGNRLYESTMDAGARWMLADIAGSQIRAWDSRGHNVTTVYDALRRLVEEHVRGTTADSDPRTLNRDVLVERIRYGEPPLNASSAEELRARRLNLRMRVYQHFDSAGVITNARLDTNDIPIEAYDFKGNLLHSTRRLVRDHAAIPNWRLSPQLETETFGSTTRYDALNRPIQAIPAHSSLARAKCHVIQPVYNDASLLERVDVWVERTLEPARVLDTAADPPSGVGVVNIDYNARGQRIGIEYKNGASTKYRYDAETFRLIHVYTRRGATFTEDCDNPAPPPSTIAAPEVAPQGTSCGLQNTRYTYDPAGNVTRIVDQAQQTRYFRNKRVAPGNDYTYDALYRLIQATGREHLGQKATGIRNAPTAPGGDNAFHTGLAHPGDGKAMGGYIERYVYDAVGNFVEMQHRGSDPANAGWTRAYAYSETSLIEDGSGGTTIKKSNRLAKTTLNPNGAPIVESYRHDPHGNVVRLPHLGGASPAANVLWDYRDRLRETNHGGGGKCSYVYDASGQRVRKVWEKSAGVSEERIYLGSFEVFRLHAGSLGASSATFERETLHVMDDQRRVALVDLRTWDPAGVDQAPRLVARYQFGDQLGSVILELDGQAQIISYEEFAPYGSSTYQAVRSQTETPKRYRFMGKEKDEASGLYYCGARYYAAWIGRWTACDPMDVGNRYTYAFSNPISKSDPDGTFPITYLAGAYRTVRGDHVHQVASRTARPGAKRTTASEFWGARSISTKNPSYNDKAGQLVERAINRAQWGSDAAGGPASKPGQPKGVVELTATGQTNVGVTEAAKPSPWFEDVKSFYKLREAGLSPDDALAEVTKSAQQLEKAGAMPERVPGAPRSLPKAVKAGQALSGETPTRMSGTSGPPAQEAPTTSQPSPEPAAPAKPNAPAAAEPTAAPPPGKTAPAPGRTSAGTRVKGAVKTGGKVLGAVGVALAAKDVYKSVKSGDYGRAVETSLLTGASFTVAAPVVLAYGLAQKYHSDRTIEERAFAAGDIVQKATGSVVAGALVSAGNAVGLSIYETGADFVNGVQNFFDDW